MKRFPFTKKALLDLPPHDPDSPSREAEYTDSECVGLKLRVSKKGRKFFQHRYRHLGRKKCISLGEFPHISIPEARKRVSENIALLSRDIDPADERNHKKDDITLTTFAKDFRTITTILKEDKWQSVSRNLSLLLKSDTRSNRRDFLYY